MLIQKLGVKKLKVGHAGTLDPLASGLMIVCTGKATKRINTFQDQEKEYVAGILFGKTTPSFDLETNFDATFPTDHISAEKVKLVLDSFLGRIISDTSLFSAKFHEGKRAYEYARKGEHVALEPSRIFISSIVLLF